MKKLPFNDPGCIVTPDNRQDCIDTFRKIRRYPLHENLLFTKRLREIGVFKWPCSFHGNCYRFEKEGIVS